MEAENLEKLEENWFSNHKLCATSKPKSDKQLKNNPANILMITYVDGGRMKGKQQYIAALSYL